MKKIILLLNFVLIGLSTQSQEKKLNKNAKISFTVDGICGMCKKRIETAALKTKGVKFAFWNVNTHQLSLIMDERKTNVAAIQKNITKIGHDIILSKNKKIKATDEAYNALHACCKYRDEEIVKNHEGKLKKVKKGN